MTEPKKTVLAKTDAGVALAIMDPERAIDIGALHDELGVDADDMGMSMLTRVKMPSGGGRAYEIEDDDDPTTPELATSIEGIIVYSRRVNAYWLESIDESGGGSKPDCSSDDGITGYGVRDNGEAVEDEHLCAECPLNEFESDPGGGKACKNQREIYILRPDDAWPLLLTLSPASLAPYKHYIARSVLKKGRVKHGLITKIGLEKIDGGSKPDYSKATFAFGGTLTDEQGVAAAAYGESLRSVVTEHTAPILREEKAEEAF